MKEEYNPKTGGRSANKANPMPTYTRRTHHTYMIVAAANQLGTIRASIGR